MKIVGSILIVLSTSAIGHWYSIDFQKRVDELQYLRQMFRMICGEIQYTQTPLSEVFRHVGRRAKDPYQKWFSYLAEEIDHRRNVTFNDIWNISIDMYLGNQGFLRVDITELKEMGTQMGCLDTKTQIGVLNLYTERLELSIQKIREGLAAKRRLSNCLGVMSGIFIAVILL